jgi:hypothetical protein
VPDARIAAEAVEDHRAGQGRVDHHELGDLVAVVQRVRGRDHQPDVVTGDHDRTIDVKMLAQQALEVVRHSALVVAARRAPGLPSALRQPTVLAAERS